MTTFIIVIHTLVCILLSMVILMQSGRGGGLTETFASAESVFGAKTNSFMVRTTAGFATIFLVTCLTLTYLSSRKERSLMSERSLMKKESTQPIGIPVSNSQLNSLKNETNAPEVQPKATEALSAVGTLTNSTK